MSVQSPTGNITKLICVYQAVVIFAKVRLVVHVIYTEALQCLHLVQNESLGKLANFAVSIPPVIVVSLLACMVNVMVSVLSLCVIIPRYSAVDMFCDPR